ncbi:MAG TPA: oligosaccharide flippase family protein, partial [Terriglobales bacterium]|nr:oligosaccharide flippase family protein [Terriglobales bacterium]
MTTTPLKMLPVIVNASGELSVARCTCAAVSSAGKPVKGVSQHEDPVSSPAAGTRGSYLQILKSSALIGGSQVANIAIGIVRTKAMALLLGPAGFGLFGLYGSIASLTQNLAGMGINSSGVRQIAEAAGTGDRTRIGQTTAVLRRTSVVLGLFGAI